MYLLHIGYFYFTFGELVFPASAVAGTADRCLCFLY